MAKICHHDYHVACFLVGSVHLRVSTKISSRLGSYQSAKFPSSGQARHALLPEVNQSLPSCPFLAIHRFRLHVSRSMARLAHAHIARYLSSHSLPARSSASLVLLLWAVNNKNAAFAIPYLRPSFQLQYYGSTRMLEWMSQKSRKIILTAFRLCGGADSGPLIRASLAFPLH